MSCSPKGTALGRPTRILHLGSTQITLEDFNKILTSFHLNQFRDGSYNMIRFLFKFIKQKSILDLNWCFDNL
jgi:hypothetical protein